MKFDARQYRAALANLGPQQARFFEPPKLFREWLENKKLPVALIDFLVENALRIGLPFPGGYGGMWTPQDMMLLNDEQPKILASKLMPLGSATVGDFIVIDLTEGVDRVGFVSHEEFSVDGALADVRQIFAPADESIHALLSGMSAELRGVMDGFDAEDAPEYPCDYYSALRLGPQRVRQP